MIGARRVQVVEGQITWFVHMIGAIIKGRLTTGSTESQEVMDGELAARVLSLLKAADSPFHLARYGDTSRQRLDIALLTFFQHFRKVRPASATLTHACMTPPCHPSSSTPTRCALCRGHTSRTGPGRQLHGGAGCCGCCPPRSCRLAMSARFAYICTCTSTVSSPFSSSTPASAQPGTPQCMHA